MSRRTPGVFEDPTGAWKLCSPARVAAGTANGVKVRRRGFTVSSRRIAGATRWAAPVGGAGGMGVATQQTGSTGRA
jgi:hypothetical protein